MRKHHHHLVLSLIAFALFVGLAATASAEEPTKGVPVENFADDYTNHFKCYSVNSDFAKQFDVSLVDQFKESHATTYRPVLLCNPVSKNGEPVPNPEYHLVCFELRQDFVPELPTVQTFNQFGDQKLEPVEAKLLCLPSKKIHL